MYEVSGDRKVNITLTDEEYLRLKYITDVMHVNQRQFFRDAINKTYNRLLAKNVEAEGRPMTKKEKKRVTVETQFNEFAKELANQGYSVLTTEIRADNTRVIQVKKGDRTKTRFIETWMMMTANPFYYIQREVSDAINEIEREEMLHGQPEGSAV